MKGGKGGGKGDPCGVPVPCTRRPLLWMRNDSSALAKGGTNGGNPGGGGKGNVKRSTPKSSLPFGEISACVGCDPGTTSTVECGIGLRCPLRFTRKPV